MELWLNSYQIGNRSIIFFLFSVFLLSYSKHMKRWSTSLILRKMQLKTVVIYHLILTGMAIIKKIKCWSECEEIGAVCIASGNLK